MAEEYSMRSYLASLILGVTVGVVYGLVKVRSPAPPAIALLGLLGMLAGEQAVSFARSHLFKSDVEATPPGRMMVSAGIDHTTSSMRSEYFQPGQ
jgi:XapX domain-containing protein